MCRLESGGGVSMNTGDIAIAARHARRARAGDRVPGARAASRTARSPASARSRPIATSTPAALPLVWLTDVKPDESIAWLASLTDNKQAVHAIAMHSAPSALNVLIRTARQDRDTRRRSDALFWLAQRAGQQAAATITDAINNDPETEVKKKAVFALSQLPHEEGVPRLIEIARTHKNPEVRKQAFFWLGQTKDPRAIAFFEEILLKR